MPLWVSKVAVTVLPDRLKYSQTALDLHTLDRLKANWLLSCILIITLLMKCVVPQWSLRNLALTLGRCLQRSDALTTSDRVPNNHRFGRNICYDRSIFDISVWKQLAFCKVDLISCFRLPPSLKDLLILAWELNALCGRPIGLNEPILVIILWIVSYRLDWFLSAFYDTNMAFFVHLLNFSLKSVLKVRLLLPFNRASLILLWLLLNLSVLFLRLSLLNPVDTNYRRFLIVFCKLCGFLLRNNVNLTFIFLFYSHRSVRFWLMYLANNFLFALICDSEWWRILLICISRILQLLMWSMLLNAVLGPLFWSQTKRLTSHFK